MNDQTKKDEKKVESRGKRPASEKRDPSYAFAAEFDDDITKIEPAILKEIKEKGLVPRWVDYLRMKDMDGYHPKGWTLYKRTPGGTMSSQEAQNGRNPDGLVRRGTLVLAVRSVEFNEKHKAYLKDRASQYVVKSRRQQAADLQRKARQHNIDTRVTEGYEDK